MKEQKNSVFLATPYTATLPVVTLGPVDDSLLQRLGERLQVIVGEPRADLAQRLELLGVGVVAGQQEAAEGARALAAPAVAAQHGRVDGIPHALQVVLLQL